MDKQQQEHNSAFEARGLSTYTLKYRPPDSCTCPKGWTLIETGTAGHFPLRTDLAQGKTRHGLIGYRRTLTPQEIEAYEIEPAIGSY